MARAASPSFSLKLRRAQLRDCKVIWEWANDPLVRQVSFSCNPIPWADHAKWFAAKLGNPNVRYFVAEDEKGSPAGQIWYEITGQESTVSVSLPPETRGKGFGPRLITLGSEALFSDTPVRLIHAYIKPNNEASLKAFRYAGFEDAGTAEVQKCSAIHMILTVERWRSTSKSENAK